jgi:hypothetical protein
MKPITKVFIVIAALVLSLVIWGLFFNQDGVLQTAYNALIEPINRTWTAVSGSTEPLLPEWTIQDADGLDEEGNIDQRGGFQ